MTADAPKPAKKEKEKRQTPEERLEALRYNHMMYGPTENELKHAPKKVDYGAPYLKHPKFQSLMAAFRKGAAFSFDVTAGGKTCSVATEDSQISFNGKTLFYARSLNRFEDNLLLDRSTALQQQTNDVLIHLVFAVLRHFPELGPVPLTYLHKKFFLGPDPLDSVGDEHASNLMLGSFKHTKFVEKPRK